MGAAHILDVKATVESWPGVETESGPGPFRGAMLTFRLGRREIGHVHPEGVAHTPFPRKVREELFASGFARPHSAGFESHVETPVVDATGVEQTIQIFRMSYDRAVAANERRR